MDMIYFHTALYYEAAAVITHYKMKKIGSIHAFQVFQDKGGNILLIVGGTGPVNGAVSAAFLLAGFSPGPRDIFVNLGICAAEGKKYSLGDVILCNQIIDGITGRALYPEMIYKHPFAEGGLYSATKIVSFENRSGGGGNAERGMCRDNPTDAVDMEGAYAFQAAAKFMSLDRIFVIKIISDFFTPHSVTTKMVTEYVMKNITAISEWLGEVQQITRHGCFQFSLREQGLLEKVAAVLKLSATMQAQLEKQCRYIRLSGGHVAEALERHIKMNIACSSKREGKLAYGRLINELSGVGISTSEPLE